MDNDKGDVKVGKVFCTLKMAEMCMWEHWKMSHHLVFLSQITRDYDAEEQDYDSEKEREDRKYSDDFALSPQSVEGNGTPRPVKQAKVNGADDHHEEDMDVSDWVVRPAFSHIIPPFWLWMC